LKSAAAKMGWTGAQWTALYDVEEREAGFSLTAQNPSSGAYGMAQFINGPSEYAQYGGNSTTAAGQATAMVNYIAQRYGNPEAAWAHELAYGWYDNGGVLPPGMTMAFNTTGQDEHIVTGPTMDNLVNGLSSLTDQLTQLTGGSGMQGFGAPVGQGTSIVSPSGGGFGITATQLGLPPQTTTSTSTSADTGDTSDTGTTTSATTTPTSTPAAATPNPAKNAAVAVAEQWLSGDIWHNNVARAKQSNAILDWLGVSKYDGTLSEIEQLDTLLTSYKKDKKTSAVSATEKLLANYGVHVFSPVMSVKGNDPHNAVVSKLESLFRGDIGVNNMTTAGQANSLLVALGTSKYSGELSAVKNLNTLLSKYEKAKDSKDVAATETLLKTYGVKKFDLGGEWPDMTLGVNTSGRSETVISGAGMDQLLAKFDKLLKATNDVVSATQAAPAATANRLGQTIANTPLTGAAMSRRYSNNR
jgi:hypothetical protein